MLKYLLLFVLFITVSPTLWCQKTDKQLQRGLTKFVGGFKGQTGIYLLDLNNMSEVRINADAVFTTASMIKVPILIGIMQKLRQKELTYHQELIYKDSLLYEGVDLLGSFKNNEKIELSKVLMLMLSMSDNTASLWLQGLAGGGLRINQIMDSLGYRNTRVNSRTPGREGNRAQYGWGQTTPYEMAKMFIDISEGKMFDRETSDLMLRLLSRNYWDEEGIGQIPAGVFIASKNGAVDASRSEVMFVNGK